ncbi:hypothetical protein [Vibrio variabilis]|uniref:hypothetical protein n=1 Tax=Vibrio variabilis TaxID=990271 RepID=UPI000DDA1778|nr:hypothetical protein [Vibrio variabilis]
MFQIEKYKLHEALVKEDISLARRKRHDADGYKVSTHIYEFSENRSVTVAASFDVNASDLKHSCLSLPDEVPTIVVQNQSLWLYFQSLDEYAQFCEFFAIDADSSLIEQFNQAAAAKA